MSERFNRGPLLVGVGLCYSRIFMDTLDGHGKLERVFGPARSLFCVGFRGDDGLIVVRKAARNCSGGDRFSRTRQGNVSFSRKKSRSWIESNPAATGQVDFGPSVEVGEIPVRSARPVERFDIRRELNQIAGNKSCGQSEI